MRPQVVTRRAICTSQKPIGPNAIWTTTLMKQSTVKSKLKRFWSPTLNDLARAHRPRRPFLRIAICRLPKFVPSHLGVHPSSLPSHTLIGLRSKRYLDYHTHKTVHSEAVNQNSKSVGLWSPTLNDLAGAHCPGIHFYASLFAGCPSTSPAILEFTRRGISSLPEILARH